MRRIEMAMVLASAWLATSPTASAMHSDGSPDACFPSCTAPLPDAIEASGATEFPDPDRGTTAGQRQACDAGATLIKEVDALNVQIQPVKEVVGYARAPQGLAIKLVNDHLFKIPGWIGFALDPVGSLKQRAIDEARARARKVLSAEGTCEEPMGPPEPPSIDAS